MHSEGIAPEGAPADPTIAVVLTRRQAYEASCALVRVIRDDTEDLFRLTQSVDEGGVESRDAMSTARRLSRTLSAIDVIGWPHDHAWEGCWWTVTERERGGAGPWGELAHTQSAGEER